MNIYILAHTSGVYMYPASKKVYKTENGALKGFEELRKQGAREGLEILKAQWVSADFDEYVKIKLEDK